MVYQFQPIGEIRSCFKEKFGIPRQPGLVTEAEARIELFGEYGRPEAIAGLEAFSHLWVLFVFHGNASRNWRPTVRPPRLGGNKRSGVFSTRSPFRPNPIGISAVQITAIDQVEGKTVIHIRGGDFLDGTPVVDIKPYVPWSDSHPEAIGGFAHEKPEAKLTVVFSEAASRQCRQKEKNSRIRIRTLIEQILLLDPRPGYKERKEESGVYGMKLLDFDLKWKTDGQTTVVLGLEDKC